MRKGEMDNETKHSMKKLDPPERSRTYVYKSGHRHTLENVVAVGNEQGWDRIQTADGKLHTVLTVIKKGDLVVDYCISRELDTDAWTF
jgi:ribosomal protein S5